MGTLPELAIEIAGQTSEAIEQIQASIGRVAPPELLAGKDAISK